MSGLVVSGVTVHAGGRAILDSVDFSAPAGKVTGLVGPNGAGKSTLIGAVLGLIRLTAGQIRFGAADLPNMAPAERARLCAHVEQAATTSERLTVRDVVSLGRLPYQTAWQATPSAHDEVVVTAALAETGMSAFSSRLYYTLSGGEQQRVQIARALTQEPRLLLLDEPTSHLDVKAQLQVLETLGRHARQGCTVVIALHDLNLAARYCDHLVMLKAGHVAAEGPPQAVIDATLLRDVYGVEATILRPETSPYPLVVYDRAITDDSAPKPD